MLYGTYPTTPLSHPTTTSRSPSPLSVTTEPFCTVGSPSVDPPCLSHVSSSSSSTTRSRRVVLPSSSSGVVDGRTVSAPPDPDKYCWTSPDDHETSSKNWKAKKGSTPSFHSSFYLFLFLLLVAISVLLLPFLFKRLPYQNNDDDDDVLKTGSSPYNKSLDYFSSQTTPTPPSHLYSVPPKQPESDAPPPLMATTTSWTVLQHGPTTASSTRSVQSKDTVTVHATGSVKHLPAPNQVKKFWSTKDPGQQLFSYQAGIGQVIKGWDTGVMGMKEGEIRQITIPPHEGYGSSGFPAWGIPPSAELQFEIEVVKIE